MRSIIAGAHSRLRFPPPPVRVRRGVASHEAAPAPFARGTVLHAAQQQIKAEAQRFNVLACGRRFGKTTLCMDLAHDTAVEAAAPVGWFAPTYKLLGEPWRDMLRLLRPLVTRSNATERRIELRTGGVLEFWSLEDPDAGRSRRYQRVIIDEAGLMHDLAARWQEAIRPTLADVQGDAWFAGTPKGRNFFWTAWQWGADPTRAEWASWQMPTHANPYILAAEVDAMRAAMSERTAAQELDATFVEDGGGVFRNVRAAASATPQQAANPDHAYVIGVDWGRTHDATVITVLDTTLKAMAFLDRFTQTDYQTQITRLRAVWERFGRCAVFVEQNSMGGPLLEQLSREGMAVRGFQTTSSSKATIIDALALAFERGDIAILPDPLLLAELEAFEASTLPSGAIRYAAPEAMHDDFVMSLAIAWHYVGRASSAVGAFAL